MTRLSTIVPIVSLPATALEALAGASVAQMRAFERVWANDDGDGLHGPGGWDRAASENHKIQTSTAKALAARGLVDIIYLVTHTTRRGWTKSQVDWTIRLPENLDKVRKDEQARLAAQREGEIGKIVASLD